MAKSVGRIIGHDIIFYDGPETEHESLQLRKRFLDHLWLPADLDQLTKEQIFVINRHRETAIKSEVHFDHALKARALLEAAEAEAEATSVLEIGCGKFPITINASRYLGVEIDPDAIDFLKRSGRPVCLPSSLPVAADDRPFDFVASCFAMHFSIQDDFLANLTRHTSDNAVFCFNIIADDSFHALRLVSRVARGWPLISLIKTSTMARREYFFAVSKPRAAERMLRVAGAMERISRSLS